ncbi:ABC transporter permease [Paraconexibacter antarcticus]|uniref:ABC transporter permease n=1 Tax=Paraconexibacter antarcticus TaxID=2949664 RepID=A0ABY5DXD4_9ACTN|nr:ABC transporter permease [Paraconexibacter antarcticus]UTI66680.1 ABC transporter permease [Paraconexibacter antarcticus]
MSTAPRRRAAAPAWLTTFGDAVEFGARVTRDTLSRRMVPYLGETLRQAGILVNGSLAVLLGLSLALGLVLGIEGVYGARTVGAPAVAGAFAGLGNLRELVPYAFAYMMAAKVSTGFVAELGTMRISDEIDALDVMGMNSRMYLASTRVLATWIVFPFIYPLALAVGFLGSYIAVVVQLKETSAAGFLELFWKFQNPTDLLFSATKGALMATFVVIVGCYYGYKVRGGPVEVGRAAAQSMFVNLLGIHFVGILTSELFWGGSPRLPIGG